MVAFRNYNQRKAVTNHFKKQTLLQKFSFSASTTQFCSLRRRRGTNEAKTPLLLVHHMIHNDTNTHQQLLIRLQHLKPFFLIITIPLPFKVTHNNEIRFLSSRFNLKRDVTPNHISLDCLRRWRSERGKWWAFDSIGYRYSRDRYNNSFKERILLQFCGHQKIKVPKLVNAKTPPTYKW